MWFTDVHLWLLFGLPISCERAAAEAMPVTVYRKFINIH